jgi:GMP synthase-like glutamine amidotransferase
MAESQTMLPILIFRHLACEGPGYLGEFLQQRHLPFRIVAVDQGEAIPDEVRDCAALIFMGGPMSVNDPLPWIAEELALIRRAANAGVPILGHCLGAQLISRALGGSVGPNAVKEIGWYDVSRNPDVPPGAWITGLPDTFEVFHWHGETFTIPRDAVPLLHSRFCAHQAFARGNILALQFHCEMTPEMVDEWSRLYHAELAAGLGNPSVQQPDELMRAVDRRIAALQGIAGHIYDDWLERWN